MHARTPQIASSTTDPAAAYRLGSAALVARQRPDGCFEGEMVWNTMILSQRVIVGHVVGAEPADDLRAGMIRHYRSTVMPQGCWGRHAEGGPSLFCTTLAYVALRLLGVQPDDDLLAGARRWIREQPGGVLAIPTWGKLWLALVGLYDYSGVNPFPPELFLLPRRLPLHPDQLYCHTRAIYEAIAYLYGRRFCAGLGALGVAITTELYGTMPLATTFAAYRGTVSTTDLHVRPGLLLRCLYRLLVSYERLAPRRLRSRALRRCLRRIHDEQRASAGQGLSPVSGALECLAMFAADPFDPALASAIEGLECWRFEDEAAGVRYAGARSQTWDTALAVEALLAGGSAPEGGAGHDDGGQGEAGRGRAERHEGGWDHGERDEGARDQGRRDEGGRDEGGPDEGGRDEAAADPIAQALARASQFLCRAQLVEELPAPLPEGRSPVRGGWCFSDGAHRWPVSDCAAEAVGALLHAGPQLTTGQPPRSASSGGRGVAVLIGSERLLAAAEFILARQNRDGGFGSYERRTGPRWLESFNPAEMFTNCMVEGSYVECTGSSLVALCALRELAESKLSARLDQAIGRGVVFLRRSQRRDGSFGGTWGINFTYGTAFAVRGLRSAGVAPGDPALDGAARWLCSVQASDGGWGEHHSSCSLGYYVPHPESQPVMTAWAVLGLLDSTGDADHPAVRRGVQWLCAAQLDDGNWPAGALNGVFFGTGMLHYELYPAYFPLWALGRFLAVAR